MTSPPKPSRTCPVCGEKRATGQLFEGTSIRPAIRALVERDHPAWNEVVNALVLTTRPFDPYPFILLNLVLSCLAAMQAPIIMMSLNRQDAKDRIRAEHDYRVNLKAEIEIQMLHEKLDHLMLHRWEALLDVQETQAELLDELKNRLDR